LTIHKVTEDHRKTTNSNTDVAESKSRSTIQFRERQSGGINQQSMEEKYQGFVE